MTVSSKLIPQDLRPIFDKVVAAEQLESILLK